MPPNVFREDVSVMNSRHDHTAGGLHKVQNPDTGDNPRVSWEVQHYRISVLIFLALCLGVLVPATAAASGSSAAGYYDTCRSIADNRSISTNSTLVNECKLFLDEWKNVQVSTKPVVRQLSTGTRARLTSGVDDSYTRALLHMNGASGSTVFTDETGKTWSATGDAYLNISQSKFGGASLLVDGNGDYISTNDSADWDLGQNFTIDFWARFNQVPSATLLLGTNAMDSRYNTPGWLVSYQQEVGGLRFSGCQGYASWPLNLFTPWTPQAGTWYHVAITRDGTNTIRTFINGQQTGSLVNSYGLSSGTQNLFVGGINGLSPGSLNGNIDEVRISKGIARWTANFTPPTHEYGPVVAPVANFTATPATGNAPLTVQFNDTSENWPTAWSWSFGDGNSTNSTHQDPLHTYASAGTYTVNLTATNSAGSDSEVKTGYVEVTQTTFYVYADGVSQYHGFEGNSDLFRAKTTAEDFYTNISGKQGDPYSSIHWAGIGNPGDDATGSRNWNINEDANSMANNADFALHAGHGWREGILFGTANPDYKLFRTNNMSFGGNNGKAKWVAFFSCNVLEEDNWQNWKSVFNGLHILMGFDTIGLEGENQGSQFAERMTGSGIYPASVSIREAWEFTLKDTIRDESYKGAYMWAEPCKDDFLPGFGNFNEPVKEGNGQYMTNWSSFECI